MVAGLVSRAGWMLGGNRFLPPLGGSSPGHLLTFIAFAFLMVMLIECIRSKTQSVDSVNDDMHIL